MDLEIKQKLTSNWFKSLQEMFCKTISDFEKNKISFKSTSWKRNLKKDEGGGEYRICLLYTSDAATTPYV